MARTPAAYRPDACEHNRAPWRATSLSADGKKRYGICPMCKQHVSEPVNQKAPAHVKHR